MATRIAYTASICYWSIRHGAFVTRLATKECAELTASASPSYRADIDGLRGIAVLGVVLFHLNFGAPGGFVGVDVFFVISGFLITRLILKAQDQDRFSLVEFWRRRIRRLMPAAMAMLAGTLLIGAWLLYPYDFYVLCKSALAQAAMISNIFFESHLDYFAGPAELHPLLHTWSLAVEEQFYLLFPLLLIALRKGSPRRGENKRLRSLAFILGIIGAVSLTLAAFQLSHDPPKAFFMLPPRAWELLVGAGLAIAPLPAADSKRLRFELLSFAGLAAILWCFIQYNTTMAFPGAAALPPCLGTAAVIYAGSCQSTRVSRWLSWRPLVGLGLISYSLYLWHWPIAAYAHYAYGARLSLELKLGLLPLMVAMGCLSWRFVETPFRQGQVSRAVSIRLSGGFALVTVSLIAASMITRGLPSRWGQEAASLLSNSKHTVQTFRTGDPSTVERDQLPRFGDPDAEPTLLIWGDSHAGVMGHACDMYATQHGMAGYIACRGGTIPLLDTWRNDNRRKAVTWNAAVLEFVRRHKIQHVMLVARWSGNICKEENGHSDSLIYDAQTTAATPESSEQVLLRGLVRTATALQEAGARVCIMEQAPEQELEPFRQLISAIRDQRQPFGVTRKQHQRRQQSVQRVLAEFVKQKQVRLVDPADHWFDAQGRSLLGAKESCFYADSHHLSRAGARILLRPTLEPLFSEWSVQRVATQPQKRRGTAETDVDLRIEAHTIR